MGGGTPWDTPFINYIHVLHTLHYNRTQVYIMGNVMAKGYIKGIHDPDDIKEGLHQQLETHQSVIEEDKEIDWNVHRLMKKSGKHLAVLVPEGYPIAISFGISLTNDRNEVMPSYKVYRLKNRRPEISNISKYDLIGTTDASLNQIMGCYLNRLEEFGKFKMYTHNCVDFTKMFTAALTKQRIKDIIKWQVEAATSDCC